MWCIPPVPPFFSTQRHTIDPGSPSDTKISGGEWSSLSFIRQYDLAGSSIFSSSGGFSKGVIAKQFALVLSSNSILNSSCILYPKASIKNFADLFLSLTL